MGKRSLETHILEELTSWNKGFLESYQNDDTYNPPFLSMSSKTQMSVGKLEELEIHKGNPTEVYFEIDRFKPVKCILLAVPNLRYKPGSRWTVSAYQFEVHTVYESPDGVLYSGGEIVTYENEEKESPTDIPHSVAVPVTVPFDYVPCAILGIAKANKLIKRNPLVLEEIRERIQEMDAMKEKLLGMEQSLASSLGKD